MKPFSQFFPGFWVLLFSPSCHHRRRHSQILMDPPLEPSYAAPQSSFTQ